MSLQVRAWREGDEAHIVESFNTAFGEQRDAAYWRWKYRHEGTALAWLCLNAQGAVLAQLAAHPVRWHSGQGEWRVGHAGDAFALRTPEAVHGRAMLRTITAFHRERESKGDLALLFGFPSVTLQGLHATLQPLQGDTQAVRRWECPVPHAGSEAQQTSMAADIGAHSARLHENLPGQLPDSAALDAFWQRCAPRYGLACVRDSAWVHWRFGQRPDVQDYAFVHCQLPDGQLAAWAVLRELNGVLWLADLLWNGVDATLQTLLLACVTQARERHCTRLALWLQGDAAATHVLQHSGWQDTTASHPVRLFLHCYEQAPPAAWVRDTLYLTKADSDLI